VLEDSPSGGSDRLKKSHEGNFEVLDNSTSVAKSFRNKSKTKKIEPVTTIHKTSKFVNKTNINCTKYTPAGRLNTIVEENKLPRQLESVTSTTNVQIDS
jgi:hypothetical protein